MGRPRYTPTAIREWRQQQGLTQEALAAKAGYSTSMISMLETGERQYTQESLEAIAAALTCSPVDLFVPPSEQPPLAKLVQSLTAAEQRQVEHFIRAIRAEGAAA